VIQPAGDGGNSGGLEMNMNPRVGTCSWNYDSWVGLVYTKKCRTAAQYLSEYSNKYRTVEIDSWFYRLPDRNTVLDYVNRVDADFRFTCKIPNAISLTHVRTKKDGQGPSVNPGFLSSELFLEYLQAAAPMSGQIDAHILEFEYLNRQKMKSLDHFLRALDSFLPSVPRDIPLAVETRNRNYLKPEYFQFLQENRLIHVFSEKLYMPHVYDVYDDFGDKLVDKTVIRLLGGDRKEIENKTRKKWNTIVEPRNELKKIAGMTRDLCERGIHVTVNVNNHYEGSAPLTIDRLRGLLSA